MNTSSTEVHQQRINPYCGFFTIGSPTIALWLPGDERFPYGTETVLHTGNDGIYMSEEGRNKHAISSAGAGWSSQDALIYSRPGPLVSDGSITDGFSVADGKLQSSGRGFYACPHWGGRYRIFVVASANQPWYNDSISIVIRTIPYDGWACSCCLELLLVANMP
jgi:hypothetical protein